MSGRFGRSSLGGPIFIGLSGIVLLFLSPFLAFLAIPIVFAGLTMTIYEHLSPHTEKKEDAGRTGKETTGYTPTTDVSSRTSVDVVSASDAKYTEETASNIADREGDVSSEFASLTKRYGQENSRDSHSMQDSSVAEEGNAPKESRPTKEELDGKASDGENQTKVSNGPVGGAAILAKLKAQRAARAADTAEAPWRKPVLVLYASQLGTAAEIAKSISSEAKSKGMTSSAASMNDYGLDNLSADKTPFVVLVASSTGDGDPPDNATRFYAALRKKSQPSDRLQGIKFTCLGLGDSNYTRFMHVPRSLRARFQELGAVPFYDFGEADEVDGLEEVVDGWLEGFWKALENTLKPETTRTQRVDHARNQNGKTAKGKDGALTLPPLPQTTVKLEWLEEEQGPLSTSHTVDNSSPSPTTSHLGDAPSETVHDADNPFLARIIDARHLTTANSKDRNVIHLELDVRGSGFKYCPGDSIGVAPENNPQLVEALLHRLRCDGDRVFAISSSEDARGGASHGGVKPLRHLRWPCTVRQAFARGCDLTSPPRKSLLRLLAESASDASERDRLLYLCAREGKDAYRSEILESRPTLLDVLTTCVSCEPSLASMLEIIPPLPPRMYSVSCAPEEHPERVHVAFSVVTYESGYGIKEGVATSWLSRIAAPWLSATSSPPQREGKNDTGEEGASRMRAPPPDVRVPIFLRKGGSFKPPVTLESPWIMIGPGTGVAPFRGFLQERRARLRALHLDSTEDGANDGDGGVATGTVHHGLALLYFGCRHRDQDYLYRKDLEKFRSDGTLDELHVAFSRIEGKEKMYVQHLMAQHSAKLFDLIVKRSGFVFVCGDGAAMAKDVQATLLVILQEQGGLSVEQASALLDEMAKQGRYVRDIWS